MSSKETISSNENESDVVKRSEVNDDEENIPNDDEAEVTEKHENNDNEDDNQDSPLPSGPGQRDDELVKESSPKDERKLQTKTEAKTTNTKSTTKQQSESSLIDYFKNLLISSVHASSQYLLSWIGISSGQNQLKCSNDPKSQSKRKRDDLKESGDDGYDDSVEFEDEDSPGLEEKRWRPDIVLQAVERFITNFWGEKDSNENIKDNENDENMNSFISSGGNEGTWNKRPDINFFSDSVVADIHDVNDKGKNFYFF